MQSLKQTISSYIPRSLQDVFQVIGGALLLSFAANIAIPFLPVPLTMQTFAVMFLAVTLGKVKGTLSVITYIAASMTGLPVFFGMSAAPFALIGIRGGYIFGFVVQAYLTGALFEKYSKASFSGLLAGLLVICALQMGMGVLWLSTFIGLKQAFIAGFLPFIIGETVKSAAIVMFAKKS